jgi:phosphoglycolate phosphatase-like HAD superfamily hydrolase
MFFPNGIRAILFDLDGTLRITRPAGGAVFSDHVSKLGAALSEEDRMRAARWEHLHFADSPELPADQQAC